MSVCVTQAEDRGTVEKPEDLNEQELPTAHPQPPVSKVQSPLRTKAKLVMD